MADAMQVAPSPSSTNPTYTSPASTDARKNADDGCTSCSQHTSNSVPRIPSIMFV